MTSKQKILKEFDRKYWEHVHPVVLKAQKTFLKKSLDTMKDETLEEISPRDLAMLFHNVYENLAPKFGYKTRIESQTDFEELPGANKKLMLATAREVLEKLSSLIKLKTND